MFGEIEDTELVIEQVIEQEKIVQFYSSALSDFLLIIKDLEKKSCSFK